MICMFFCKDTRTTEIYTYEHTLSLPDALPISAGEAGKAGADADGEVDDVGARQKLRDAQQLGELERREPALLLDQHAPGEWQDAAEARQADPQEGEEQLAGTGPREARHPAAAGAARARILVLAGHGLAGTALRNRMPTRISTPDRKRDGSGKRLYGRENL